MGPLPGRSVRPAPAGPPSASRRRPSPDGPSTHAEGRPAAPLLPTLQSPTCRLYFHKRIGVVGIVVGVFLSGHDPREGGMSGERWCGARGAGKLLRAHGGCLGAEGRGRAWADCEKPRGAVNRAVIRGYPNGATRPGRTWSLPAEHIGRIGASGGTETSQYPEEKRVFPE